MNLLEVTNISKSYGGTQVFDAVDISLPQEQTLAILGQSGCGKTTMLKCLAGLTPLDAGRVVLEGKNVTQAKPSERQIVYLYQEDLLFPHLNVYDNIAFGLRLRKMEEVVIKQQVDKMLASIGLTDHSTKMPTQISGGQRQRVSFGRAIIIQPRLLLLDEPFGSLDVDTRCKMQELFKALCKEYNMASVFVTHDLKEALLMGDQWGYMEAGRLKTYHKKQDFIDDPMTGIKSEISFWNTINMNNEY